MTQDDTNSSFNLERLDYQPLTKFSHNEPDLHLIGDAIAQPSVVNDVSSVAESLGTSLYPAREDHVHYFGGSPPDPGLFSARLTLVTGVAVPIADVTTTAATGGTITTNGAYTVHTFTTSGTFTPSASLTTEILVVAGGGSGGNGNASGYEAGGGGGGGLVYHAAKALTAQAYTVTIGAGGVGGGNNGANSVFGDITALGGGKGASSVAAGSTGGSGGGGAHNQTAGGVKTQGDSGGGTGFGNNGGTPNAASKGGGGGGSGGAGGVTGAGGIGKDYSISGSSIGYAGGGGGYPTGATVSHGGGAGGTSTPTAGTTNRGGGGGGYYGASGNGAAGGSGIVIVSYLTPTPTLYLTPYLGNKVTVYSGSAWELFSLTEISKTVTATSGSPYDVFLYSNAGVLTLEFLVWTNSTTRATALVLQDGILVKSGATTRRYVGSFYASATDNIKDTAENRFLYNYYNRVDRTLFSTITTSTWTFGVLQYINGSSTFCRIIIFMGVNEEPVTVIGVHRMESAVSNQGIAYIGLDSATALVGSEGLHQTSTWCCPTNTWIGFIGLGYHYLALLEATGYSPNTMTGYGSSSLTNIKGSLRG